MCYEVLFFFRQKTAYEMRISDGSSDVCSSDLDRCRAVFSRRSIEKTAQGRLVALEHGEGRLCPAHRKSIVVHATRHDVGVRVPIDKDSIDHIRRAFAFATIGGGITRLDIKHGPSNFADRGMPPQTERASCSETRF